MMDHDVFCDDGPPISQLQAAVKALEEYVHQIAPPRVPSVNEEENESAAKRSAKKASNARPTLPTPVQLFGRQEFARSKWRELGRAHVAIYGLGAIGALVAESLVRSGIGKLLLVDHARVQMSSMGGMAFYPDEIGFSRTQALRLRLQSISRTDASTCIDSFCADLSNDADLVELKKHLKVSSVVNSRDAATGSSQISSPRSLQDNTVGLFEALALKRPYDAIICCADDETAKFRLNEICLQLSLPLLDVEIPPNNAMVSIRAVLPGHTCCLECIRQQEEATHLLTPMDQVARSIARAFPASLPHVETTAAGLLAQSVIKYVPLQKEWAAMPAQRRAAAS